MSEYDKWRGAPFSPENPAGLIMTDRELALTRQAFEAGRAATMTSDEKRRCPVGHFYLTSMFISGAAKDSCPTCNAGPGPEQTIEFLAARVAGAEAHIAAVTAQRGKDQTHIKDLETRLAVALADIAQMLEDWP